MKKAYGLSILLILIIAFSVINYTYANSWITPTGHYSVGDWRSEQNARDDNLGSYASTSVRNKWTQFLTLYLSASITSDKIRMWLKQTHPYYTQNVDIDIQKDASWVDLFDGTGYDITTDTWWEIAFTEGSVNIMRIRVYLISYSWFRVYETDFWEIPTGEEYSFTLNETISFSSKSLISKEQGFRFIDTLSIDAKLFTSIPYAVNIPVLFTGALIVFSLTGFIFLLAYRKKRE